MSFYDNFVRLCAKRGQSPSGAAVAMGYSRGAVTRWKTDTNPSYSTITRVAEYFRVEPEELMYGEILSQTGLEKEVLMSCDERELLNAWRKADITTKENVAYLLRHNGFKKEMLLQGLQQRHGNE